MMTFCVCTQFDWLAFIKRVVESKDEPARSVSSSEHVIVRAPAYFKELFKLIDGTDARCATATRGRYMHNMHTRAQRNDAAALSPGPLPTTCSGGRCSPGSPL